jgi:hypothetical protein
MHRGGSRQVLASDVHGAFSMDVAWGLGQVLQAAVQHKEEIAPWFRRGWEYLFGKPFSIAFTGMQGVGKTVLLDHLTGRRSSRDTSSRCNPR